MINKIMVKFRLYLFLLVRYLFLNQIGELKNQAEANTKVRLFVDILMGSSAGRHLNAYSEFAEAEACVSFLSL